ncbi:putative fatty acyl-CoA reductase CG5065 [Belonocnema kinseyi]|uniref:putative fatty acyl-CoA reductase CG5065 n=1 Tax=Belonocnema kinseyi TaxID=2817044 RepID=UPI00143D8A20|nr:putative fatty acyl-CoA reductase CG5065 [Belonocnema kinseyi]
MKPNSINELLADSTIFLTGVTGFIGGTLLERILKTCPGPKKVYVLVRNKCDHDASDRVKQILSSPLFSDVKPERLQIVEIIPGDITVEGLGISASYKDLLISTCTHVFHSAAYISFAAHLDLAIKINLVGARNVLNLVKEMRKIQCMVHLSTAYANCTKDRKPIIEEKLYPIIIDPNEFINKTKNLSKEEIAKRTFEFLGNHPNTYTLTKQMAEHLMSREKEGLALSIVRPGIVLNSWKEPIAGWVDNVNSGACGLIAGVSKGLFRTFQANPNYLQDFIPVDMVVSTILASALYAVRNPTQMHIFHCTSSSVNPTTYREYCKVVTKCSREHPCRNVLWYPEIRPRSSYLRHTLVMYIFHMGPAYVIDFLRKLTNAKYKFPLLKLQQRFAKGTKYVSYFTTKQWTFSRVNAEKLFTTLPPNEITVHPMDPSIINWNEYFEDCVLGTRKYYHKEPDRTTEEARRRIMRLQVISNLVPFLSFTVLWYITCWTGCSLTTGALLSAVVIIFMIWI